MGCTAPSGLFTHGRSKHSHQHQHYYYSTTAVPYYTTVPPPPLLLHTTTTLHRCRPGYRGPPYTTPLPDGSGGRSIVSFGRPRQVEQPAGHPPTTRCPFLHSIRLGFPCRIIGSASVSPFARIGPHGVSKLIVHHHDSAGAFG